MAKPLGCTERLFNKLKELTNKDKSLRPPLKELLDILESKIIDWKNDGALFVMFFI